MAKTRRRKKPGIAEASARGRRAAARIVMSESPGAASAGSSRHSAAEP